MSRAVLATILALGLAAPVAADVTIKQTTTGKGLGMSGSAASTTRIKGSKMRTDLVTGDTTRSTIFDLDAQKMYAFDSKKKEADVWDMTAVAADVTKSTDVSGMKATITANGKTKELLGKTATGYDMSISLPAKMGGSGEIAFTANLSGPVWIVKDAPGTADWTGFYKAAAEKGWIFSDPRAAKGAPGQARATTEMYRKMAEIGGIAYETETNIKLEGSGPMAGLLAKMGGVQATSTTTEVTAGALGDDVFAVPAGYELKERK